MAVVDLSQNVSADDRDVMTYFSHSSSSSFFLYASFLLPFTIIFILLFHVSLILPHSFLPLIFPSSFPPRLLRVLSLPPFILPRFQFLPLLHIFQSFLPFSSFSFIYHYTFLTYRSLPYISILPFFITYLFLLLSFSSLIFFILSLPSSFLSGLFFFFSLYSLHTIPSSSSLLPPFYYFFLLSSLLIHPLSSSSYFLLLPNTTLFFSLPYLFLLPFFPYFFTFILYFANHQPITSVFFSIFSFLCRSVFFLH